jgi:hypothetical protein
MLVACRRLVPVCLLALGLIVAGCGNFGVEVSTPVPPSGIRGSVVLGPTCPNPPSVGPSGQVPCLTPYAAQLVVLDSEGKVVTRTTSGSDGTFEVDVPPGDYVIAPATNASYPIAQPVSVQVTPGNYAEAQINYDTGLR